MVQGLIVICGVWGTGFDCYLWFVCGTRLDCYLWSVGYKVRLLFVVCGVQGLTVICGLWGAMFDC